MKKLTYLGLAMTAVFSLITGCAPPASPTAAAAKQVQTLWKVPADLVGTPQVVGDTIVSYTRAKGRLLVSAWDLAQGRKLWSADAATSGDAPGIELSVETVTVKEKSYVAFFKNNKGETWRELVIADLRTGPRKSAKPLFVWPSSAPRTCSDGKAFCLLGYRPSAWPKEVNLRVDPLRPALVVDQSDGLPTNSRLLGYDIFATEDRPPKGVEMIGQVKDGKTTWQRPYTDVFGPSSSSDEGWALRDTYKEVIAGIGYPDLCTITTTNGTKRKTCDATHNRMVGLNHATGATVWSVESVDTCPGASVLTASSKDRLIICRNFAGSSTYVSKGDWWNLESMTRTSELIAIAPQTGEILWHTDLGTQAGAPEPTAFIASADHLLLRINGKTISYDLSTGAATAADDSSKLMCQRDRPPLRLHRLGDDEPSEYNISENVEPCDGTGKAITTIAPEWVPEAGIDAGDDRWLMTTPGAMMLVHLS